MSAPVVDTGTVAWLKMPLQSVFDHAAGDPLVIDAAHAAAYVDERLRRDRESEQRGEFPCVTWIREALGWSLHRAQRALAHAVTLGFLNPFTKPIEFVDRHGVQGVRMSTRYAVNVGVWNEYRSQLGWVKVERRHSAHSSLHVAVLLVNAYEARQNHCIETTTSEIAAMLGCRARTVRKHQGRLRDMQVLDDVSVRPGPGRRFGRLSAWWLTAPLERIDYLGAPMMMFQHQDMRRTDSKRLLSIRDQLNRTTDGERVIRQAALTLGRYLDDIPTVRQVVRWVVRRYRHLLDPESHANNARGRILSAALGRSPEFAARRAEVLRTAALQLAGAPPG